jgi:hypothetical protein
MEKRGAQAMAHRTAVIAALVAAVLGGRALAQETPAPEPAKPEVRKPDTKADRTTPRPEHAVGATLRVQLVISRYQGERKTGSLPYTFTVAAGGEWVRMRMGIETPVPVTSTRASTKGPAGEGSPPPTMGFEYRNVGTNIDCRAVEVGDGRYSLGMRVQNSSALAGVATAGQASFPGVPLFRQFDATIEPVLSDGQSIQTIASTDPVTGEVVKVDVTMNVVR